MPWYKSGTVNVTLNSSAVIGVGTAFIANGRVGDAFRGPDGGWYEVTNIASDTAMSISPTYKGATSAAGGYALAPMQGYVKDSADALRALVNTYGTKLAALGTTGNYDTLPVSKGGTGGTDQAGARSGLGLGSASIEDIVPIAKGGTGGSDQAGARTALGLGSVATENTVPLAKGGTGGTSQATARTGLGLKSAAIADIVGTVLQSGGVPTGAIIESGSNAAGRYTKFASGLVICELVAFDMSVGANANTPIDRGLPAAVLTAPGAVVYATAQPNQSNVHYGFNACFLVNATSARVFHFNGPAPQIMVAVSIIVIGRWF